MARISIPDRRTEQIVKDTHQRLMDGFAFAGGRISGEEILKFSPHRQINLFILFQVYQDLGYQLSLVVRNGFQADNPEVLESLRQFQSVLSRHISIRKEDFSIRVEKAIYNSLRLISDPGESLQRFFFGGVEQIPLDLFRKNAHFFSDFDFFIQSIIRYFEKNEIHTVSRTEFVRLFEKVGEIFEKKENRSLLQFQEELFTRAFGVPAVTAEELTETVADLLIAQNEPEEEPVQKKPIAETFPRAQKVDIYSLQKETPVKQPETQVVQPPVEEVQPVIEAQVSHPPVNLPEAPVAEPVMQVQVQETAVVSESPRQDAPAIDLFSGFTEKKKEEPANLGERFRTENKTSNLNDRLQTGGGLAHIPVHKQFQYIQKIFKGNNVKFKAAIEKLGEAASSSEVEEILQKYVFNNPEVDPRDPLCLEFAEMVKGRF